MKKMIISLFMVLFIVSGSSVLYASDEHHEIYTEIGFRDNTMFSTQQKQNIINHFLVSNSSGYTINGLFCLFGHNLTTERTPVTHHRYYPTVPRCLREYYDISACSRCDYVSSSFVTSEKVFCCS